MLELLRICSQVVSASKSHHKSPSSFPGRAKPQYPISVNAMLLPLCGELMVQSSMVQSSMHHIFTHMYSTASMVPLFMGSPTEIAHTPHPPSNCLSPHFTIEPLISASLPVTPSSKPSKQLKSKFVTFPAGKPSWTAAPRNGHTNH